MTSLASGYPQHCAQWATKHWPVEYFGEVGRRASKEFGAGLVAVGSEDDRPRVDALLRELAMYP